MVTQTTLPNSLINSLTRMAEPARAFAIHAQWCVISVMPDLATNERLNIGVCVKHNDVLHSKFLPNAEPFKKLYGKQGGENFGFLMRLVQQTLNANNWQFSCSPQIQHSQARDISGNDIDEILNRLYNSMVTLALMQKEPVQRVHISTQDLRQTIFNKWKSQHHDLAERVWHNEDNPIIIPAEWGDRGQQTELNHIQLWTPPDYTNPAARFGAIVSLDYQQANFAELYLLQAAQDMLQAHTTITKKEKKGALFVYRPKYEHFRLEKQLDKTYYLLRNQMKHHLTMEVESDIDVLSQMAQAFSA